MTLGSLFLVLAVAFVAVMVAALVVWSVICPSALRRVPPIMPDAERPPNKAPRRRKRRKGRVIDMDEWRPGHWR